MARLVALGEGHIITRVEALEALPSTRPEGDPSETTHLETARNNFERDFIRRILIAHDGEVEKSAQALGISRKNLWEKRKKLGI